MRAAYRVSVALMLLAFAASVVLMFAAIWAHGGDARRFGGSAAGAFFVGLFSAIGAAAAADLGGRR